MDLRALKELNSKSKADIRKLKKTIIKCERTYKKWLKNQKNFY